MWCENIVQLQISPDNHIYDWLTKPYILSQALRKVCVNLSVKVLTQKLQTDNSLIRQVYLLGDDIPWVFAETLVAADTYQQYKDIFDKLNNNLIGETLLYGNPNTKRYAFEYALIEHNNSSLWARRSDFNICNYKLTITEAFLPDIPRYAP